MAFYKNKASQKLAVYAYDSTDASAKTGDAANISAQISLDGGATAATNDVAPTELDAADAPGVYIFDTTQAESNADLVILAAVSATSNILLEPLLIYTEPEQRIAASVAGAVGSVTGAVGSVAGNVDGSTASVTGAVGSVAGNVDGSVASLTGHTVQTGDSYARIGVAGVSLSNIPLPATGLDLILKSSTFALAIADAIWDEILTGATHNVTNSAGKRLRQIDASFVVDSGTAQAGGVATITLAAGSSSVDDIYRGDRVIIVGGTGIGEHEIIKSYNGTTKVATMNESWVVQPDATSEYDLTPATVDIGTWKHESVTVSATTALPEMDAKSISDNAAAADSVQANIGNLDAAVSIVQTDLDTLTDARGEPAQGAPAVSATTNEKIDFLYKAWRNRSNQTATTYQLFNDDAATVDHKATVSDDATTAEKGEVATGP